MPSSSNASAVVDASGNVINKTFDPKQAGTAANAVVIGKIEQGARKGAKSWQYVEAMLADVQGAWNAGADATDPPVKGDGQRYITGKYADMLEW